MNALTVLLLTLLGGLFLTAVVLLGVERMALKQGNASMVQPTFRTLGGVIGVIAWLAMSAIVLVNFVARR